MVLWYWYVKQGASRKAKAAPRPIGPHALSVEPNLHTLNALLHAVLNPLKNFCAGHWYRRKAGIAKCCCSNGTGKLVNHFLCGHSICPQCCLGRSSLLSGF